MATQDLIVKDESNIPVAPEMNAGVPDAPQDAPQMDNVPPPPPGDINLPSVPKVNLIRTLSYRKYMNKTKENLEQESAKFQEEIKKTRDEITSLEGKIAEIEELQKANTTELKAEIKNLEDTVKEVKFAETEGKPKTVISQIERRKTDSENKISALENDAIKLPQEMATYKKQIKELKVKIDDYRLEITLINRAMTKLGFRKGAVGNKEEDEAFKKYMEIVNAFPKFSIDDLELLYLNKYNKNIFTNLTESKGKVFFNDDDFFKLKNALIENASNVNNIEARDKLEQILKFSLVKGDVLKSPLGANPRQKLEEILGYKKVHGDKCDFVEKYKKDNNIVVDRLILEKAKAEYQPGFSITRRSSAQKPEQPGATSLFDVMKKRVKFRRPDIADSDEESDEKVSADWAVEETKKDTGKDLLKPTKPVATKPEDKKEKEVKKISDTPNGLKTPEKVAPRPNTLTNVQKPAMPGVDLKPVTPKVTEKKSDAPAIPAKKQENNSGLTKSPTKQVVFQIAPIERSNNTVSTIGTTNNVTVSNNVSRGANNAVVAANNASRPVTSNAVSQPQQEPMETIAERLHRLRSAYAQRETGTQSGEAFNRVYDGSRDDVARLVIANYYAHAAVLVLGGSASTHYNDYFNTLNVSARNNLINSLIQRAGTRQFPINDNTKSTTETIAERLHRLRTAYAEKVAGASSGEVFNHVYDGSSNDEARLVVANYYANAAALVLGGNASTHYYNYFNNNDVNARNTLLNTLIQSAGDRRFSKDK